MDAFSPIVPDHTQKGFTIYLMFRKRAMTTSRVYDDTDVEHGSSDSTDDERGSAQACFCESPRPVEPHFLPSNPQSPTEDVASTLLQNSLSYGDKKSKGVPLVLVGFVLVALAAVSLSRTSVDYVANQANTMVSNRDHLSDKLRKFQRDMLMLKRELSALDILMEDQAMAGNQGSASEVNQQLQLNELNALQTRIQDLSHKSADMKQRVKDVSHQQLLEKYGGGVKQVEMELYFPDGKDGPTKFVIALEDNLMPHSSFVFLEMVSTGLLDGCSFILNALHVLKAAPLPYDGSSAAAKAKAFTELGLESVAFKEYSTSMPHTKNTIGFAADGSPSFFINTEDNSEIHAGDPCFGRIIEGFDTIKRLESSPTRNGIWFAKRIGIKKARVL